MEEQENPGMYFGNLPPINLCLTFMFLLSTQEVSCETYFLLKSYFPMTTFIYSPLLFWTCLLVRLRMNPTKWAKRL